MKLITIDESGRVLIPKQVREQLGIKTEAQLSLEIKEGRINTSWLSAKQY